MGISSASTAESSFRELDDVFLQTQTRIWLGEVLKMRLDEQLHVSDLLADGDLLFEVSKVLWNMLLAKCGELRHLKYEPLGSRRCSGRYMPYSNVDSFLKICKILGLNGIDLFSPSDVVEKKNIRKVCICIRALSNKARSKQLKVPDFDLVTYTVVMPKDMVGGIRRSLESSQRSLSSSSGYYSHKEARSKLMERNQTAESEVNYDSLSEESDEAESKFVGEESCSSSMNQLEDDNAVDFDADDSFDQYSAVRKTSQSRLHHSASQGNYGGKYNITNEKMHFDHSDLSLTANDESIVVDSMDDDEVESSYISDYLAFSDSVIGGTDGSTPVLGEGEENIFNLFMASHSNGPSSSERTGQNKYSDTEDAEVSSTTSMSSVLCRVRALDFDDQFDADDCLLTEASGTLLENEADRKYMNSSANHRTWNIATDELMFHDTKENSLVKTKYSCPNESQSAGREPLREKSVSLHGNSSNYFNPDEDMEGARTTDEVVLDNVKNVSLVDTSEGCAGDSEYLKLVCGNVNGTRKSSATLDGVNMDQSSAISVNCYQHVEKGQPYSCSTYGSDDANEVCEPAFPGDDGDTKHKVSHVLVKNASVQNEDTNAGPLEGKHRQRPLLKTVVRGTALVGVLYLLLHFSRKRNKQESNEAGSRPTHSKKQLRGRDISYGDGQNGRRVDKVYPSEKLKFKN